MSEFYRYGVGAFEFTNVSDLKVGDKLGFGNNPSSPLYGIVEISKITRPSGGAIFIDWIVPLGAEVSSNEDRTLSVYMSDGMQVVKASSVYSVSDHLLILKQ